MKPSVAIVTRAEAVAVFEGDEIGKRRRGVILLIVRGAIRDIINFSYI